DVFRERRPRGDGPIAQRPFRIANERSGVGALLDAEALAGRAPAEGVVEREVVGVERLKTAATAVAGEVLAVALHLPIRLRPIRVHVGDEDDALAEVQGGLDRVGEAAALAVADDDAVHDDLDLVLA